MPAIQKSIVNSLEFFAELDKSPADPEKDSRDGDKEKIKHGCFPFSRKPPKPHVPSGADAAPASPRSSATSACECPARPPNADSVAVRTLRRRPGRGRYPHAFPRHSLAQDRGTRLLEIRPAPVESRAAPRREPPGLPTTEAGHSNHAPARRHFPSPLPWSVHPYTARSLPTDGRARSRPRACRNPGVPEREPARRPVSSLRCSFTCSQFREYGVGRE